MKEKIPKVLFLRSRKYKTGPGVKLACADQRCQRIKVRIYVRGDHLRRRCVRLIFRFGFAVLRCCHLRNHSACKTGRRFGPIRRLNLPPTASPPLRLKFDWFVPKTETKKAGHFTCAGWDMRTEGGLDCQLQTLDFFLSLLHFLAFNA